MRSVKLAVLYACRAIGGFAIARWLTRNQLKILCYHGFALSDEAEFRPKLFIKKARFEQRLALLAKNRFHVLPLDEAVDRMYARTLVPNSVAITIDDGFHSVSRVAAPSLERYSYPATVYVTTYYVDNPNPVFRLVMQYMFWKSRNAELVLRGEPWGTDGIVELADSRSAEEVMWQCIEHGETQCTEAERVDLCKRMGALLGVRYEDIAGARLMSLMNPAELQALADSKVSVELHTHRHRFPADDRALAEQEIADNRKALAQWIPGELRHFCYPSGLYDAKQESWLDEMGIKSSTTCVPGVNSHTTPRHALHRFLDGENIHSLEFEAALSGFTNLLPRGRSRHVD